MMRVAVAFVFLLLVGIHPVQAAQPKPERKSVLLLIGDDHGREHVGCYGNTAIQTPNLDRLAAEGVRFDNAFATTASCSPSRSVILTGLYNHTNGMYGLAHAEHHFASHARVSGLPALLKPLGYRTGVVAKLHVEPREVYPFDKVIAGPAGGRDVAGVALRARNFFAENSDQPFFLLVGFTDPHRAAKGFANERDYSGIQRIAYQPERIRVPYFLPDVPAVRQDVAEYCQSVSRLDQGVGLVLKELKEAGRDKDTLVIYLSDNGMPFPGAKTTLYDPGVHLPLLVSSPTQQKRGLVNQAMVSCVDIVPTILDWAGGKAPGELPGRSLLPILEQEKPTGWDKVYLSHTFHEVTMYYPSRGVRTTQYKYLWNLAHELPFPPASDLYNSPTYQSLLTAGDDRMGERSFKAYRQRPKEELYDLTNDPKELKNLAGHPAQAKVLEELRADVQDFQRRTRDPWVVRQKY